MPTFSSSYTVRYSEVNYYSIATPVSILSFLQETAFSHLESVGRAPEIMAARHETWIIYKWYVKILTYPRWKEKITVTTWISEFKSHEVVREFEIYNAHGELLVFATALALLINTTKGKPKKIDKEEKSVWKLYDKKASHHLFNPFNITTIPIQWEKSFEVRYSDIDSNLHVNNTRYLDWFMENIPYETHINYQLATLEIVYRLQTKYGETIHISTAPYGQEENKLSYISEIKNSSQKTVARIRAQFKRNILKDLP